MHLSTLLSSLPQLSTCSSLSTTHSTGSFPMLLDWLFPFLSPGLSCRSLPFPFIFHALPLGQEGLLHCAFKLPKLHLSPCHKSRELVGQGLQPGKVPLLPPWERRAKEKSPASSQPCSQGDTANSHPPGHRGRDPHPKEEACHPHSSW